MARTGNPDATGLPVWPIYHNNMLMRFTPAKIAAAVDPYAARVAAVNAASIDILPE